MIKHLFDKKRKQSEDIWIGKTKILGKRRKQKYTSQGFTKMIILVLNYPEHILMMMMIIMGVDLS